MIYVLEGPDRSGKTTLFNGIVCCRKLQMPKLSKQAFQHIVEIEAIELSMWNAMYVGQELLLDRSLFISGRVYAKLYGRNQVDASGWHNKITVLYLDAPLSLLLSRTRTDDKFDNANYQRLLELYEEELKSWPRLYRLDASLPTERLVEIASSIIMCN